MADPCQYKTLIYSLAKDSLQRSKSLTDPHQLNALGLLMVQSWISGDVG